MTKESTKKLLRIAVILYIVILSGVAVTSLAWFVFEDTTSLQTNDNYMKIVGGDELAIALLEDGQTADQGNYDQSQTVPGRKPLEEAEDAEGGEENADDEGSENFEGYVYPDISGNGSTFYYPKFVHKEDGAENVPPKEYIDGNYVTITKANGNMDAYMVVLRVGFRSATPTTVYLHNESSVTGDTSDNGGSIANAVRVAFHSPTDSTTYVWCPNESNASEIKYLSVQGETIAETSYTTQSFLDRDVIIGRDQLASSVSGETPAMINNAPPIISFDEEDFKEANQGYVYKEVEIYIWVEGTDPDSVDENKDQTLQYELHFIGINKSVTTDSLNNIKYENGQLIYNDASSDQPKMVYSTDGIEWKSYSNSLELGNATEFYVRFAETASTQPGVGEGSYKIFPRN